MSAEIEKLLVEIEERVAKIRVLLAAREQLELFPKKRRATPSIPAERNSVAVIDFRELWSQARQDSHYMKPWMIPAGSDAHKKLFEVAKAIQERYPKYADQTFYATCEKYFESEDARIVGTKHCLEMFCFKFNDFLQFRPQLETTHDGVVTKAGYTGSGKWVEPKALVQSQLLQEAREK